VGCRLDRPNQAVHFFAHILFSPYFWLDLILAIRNTPNNLNYLKNQTILENSKILAEFSSQYDIIKYHFV
jgi:hypothetical protein